MENHTGALAGDQGWLNVALSLVEDVFLVARDDGVLVFAGPSCLRLLHIHPSELLKYVVQYTVGVTR
jgi:hypothetical protein